MRTLTVISVILLLIYSACNPPQVNEQTTTTNTIVEEAKYEFSTSLYNPDTVKWDNKSYSDTISNTIQKEYERYSKKFKPSIALFNIPFGTKKTEVEKLIDQKIKSKEIKLIENQIYFEFPLDQDNFLDMPVRFKYSTKDSILSVYEMGYNFDKAPYEAYTFFTRLVNSYSIKYGEPLVISYTNSQINPYYAIWVKDGKVLELEAKSIDDFTKKIYTIAYFQIYCYDISTDISNYNKFQDKVKNSL